MPRIDRFGLPMAPSSDEELHDKNERTAVQGKSEAAEGERAAKVTQEGVRRVVAPQDAERLVSQAGYAKTKKKRPGELDLGDTSGAPIPLPEDDVDTAMWSPETIALAQTQLGAQEGVFARLMGQEELPDDVQGLFAKLLHEAVTDDAAGEARLQQMEAQPEPDAEALKAMAQDAQRRFGLELEGLAPGTQMMAASLLVAGRTEQVAVLPASEDGAPHALDGKKLVAGVQQVLDGGRRAVDDGRKMNEGVAKNLSMHRTFVAKR